MDPINEMAMTSEQICEALARHTEVSGSEVFEKNFVKPNGEVIVTVWCVVGPNARAFRDACRKWLDDHGFEPD